MLSGNESSELNFYNAVKHGGGIILKNNCMTVSSEMLPGPIEVETNDKTIGFLEAKKIAEEKVESNSPSPMLLAWFNGMTGQFSPDVTCCGDEKPTWLVYAESRGADLSVNINGGQYVFVFLSGANRS